MRISGPARTIDRRPGDKGIGASPGDFGDIVHLDAAVDLQPDSASGLSRIRFDTLPRLPQFAQRCRDEGLPAKPGIDAHQQHQVDFVHDVVEITQRRRRIEHQPGLAALFPDQ